MSSNVSSYRDPDAHARIIQGIEATGFPLEHAVVELLRSHEWTVISNRYYMDDVQPKVREIDLVAYKANKIEDFSIFTTLLISCKKSAENTWALLSRDADRGDPNTDWTPMHVWSSCVEWKYLLNETPWVLRYVRKARRSGARDLVAIPDTRIFAFQEMSHLTGRAQNDRAIFESITSLLKALGYERDALPDRIRDRRIYQFNLLSVVDAPALLRLHFSGEDVTVTPRDDDVYLADYIVNRERVAARIRFVLFEALEKLVERYDHLHSVNVEFFLDEYESFYDQVLRQEKARKLLMDRFQKRVGFHLKYSLPESSREGFRREHVEARYDETDREVHIEGGFSKENVAVLNRDTALARMVALALKDVFHYRGDFRFTEDEVPF